MKPVPRSVKLGIGRTFQTSSNVVFISASHLLPTSLQKRLTRLHPRVQRAAAGRAAPHARHQRAGLRTTSKARHQLVKQRQTDASRSAAAAAS